MPRFEQMRLTIAAVIVSGSMLAGTLHAYGDESTLAPERFHFHRLSVEDGLSDPRVLCIHQDRTGYMWFGTDDGLNRYDGREVLVFRPKDWGPKTRYVVSAIHEDSEGFLWLGETNTDFSKFDPVAGEFLSRHRHQPGAPEGIPYATHVSISAAPAGTLWIGTAWNGLARFDPQTGEFTLFPHRSVRATPDPIYSIYSSEADSDVVWLGTHLSGLVCLDAKTGELYKFRDHAPGTHAVDPPSFVSFIAEESPGVLWVAGDDAQLYRFDVKAERFRSAHAFGNAADASPARPQAITAAVRGPEGRLWVASRNAGLAEFRPGEGFRNHQRHDLVDSRSLGNDQLTSAYRDRSGVVWLGTKRDGVSFLDPGENWIRLYHIRDKGAGKPKPVIVQCFHEDPTSPNVVWLGSGSGVTRWNRSLNEWKSYVHLPDDDMAGNSNAIRCFSARRRGGFWIGSASGLSRYDPISDQLIRVESPEGLLSENDDVSLGSIRAVHEDRHGELWIGMLPTSRESPVLIRFNPATEEVQAYRHDPKDPHSIGPGWVTDIVEDRQGRLWFASRMRGEGISRFDRETGRFICYRHDPADLNSIGGDAVIALHEDCAQDILWIGTRSGLDRTAIGPDADLRKFKRVNLGTASDEILGIEQDDSGRLWLACNTGLRLIADPQQAIVDAPLVAPETAHRFNRLVDSCIKLRSGEILIGARIGIFQVQPDGFQPGEPPTVVLTQVRALGNNRSALALRSADSQKLVVSHEQNIVLNIKFAALDFTNPRRNRYSYRLEGLEQDWSGVTGANNATYTTLPAGQYVFRVKASNSRGAWNEKGASPAITVLPPWWATWWFRGGAAVALLGLAAGAVHWRNLSLRRRNKMLVLTEQRYLNLLTNTSEMLWCIEFDEPVSLETPEMEQVERLFRARVVEANEAFAKAYGSSLDAVIGKWRLEDFFPRSLPTSIPVLLEAVRSRYRMEHFETTEQAVTGETKTFVNSCMGTIENGKVLRLWGMSREVTETREIEKQIRLQQEAIESSGDGFLIADATQPDVPIIYANRRSEEITGYASDEILGRNCRFLQGPNTDKETVMRLRESLLAGTRFQGEVLNYRKDGSEFWNLLRISPVRDKSGKLTHFIGLQTDVTERKLADDASRQQRDQLAHFSRAATLVEIGAALAHELNQPLAAILRNAQAAKRFLDRDAPDLAQVGEILADIVKDDRRAGDVLGRIRQHLRKEDSRRDQVDMNDVVQDGLALLHSELIIAHIDVQLQLAEGLPLILGDTVQLQQVILNLVLNAVEAMRLAQHANSRIVIETSSPDHDTVRVSVSDSGQGIEETNLERIFDPFHTTKEQGMGVGLSINRTIVESHDGRMFAENVPDGGARFVLTIPAATSGADRDGS